MNSQTPTLLRDLGKGFWAYSGRLRATNAPIHRMMTGVWAWAWRPQSVLAWALHHDAKQHVDERGQWHTNDHGLNGRAIDAPGGPLPSVALEGWREGIVDYRCLRQCDEIARRVEAVAYWLQSVRDQTFVRLFPGSLLPAFGPDGEEWIFPDRWAPWLDMPRIRERALDYIAEYGWDSRGRSGQ